MVEIKCSKCKEETTHYAKGMCLLCYKREEFKRKYKTDPEFKRKRLESQKRYRDKNKGSMMKYFRKNPDKYKAHLKRCVEYQKRRNNEYKRIKQLQEQLNQVNQMDAHNMPETELSGEITWNKNIENVCNEIDENIKTKKMTEKEIE